MSGGTRPSQSMAGWLWGAVRGTTLLGEADANGGYGGGDRSGSLQDESARRGGRGHGDADGDHRQLTRTADALLRELHVLWKTKRPLSADVDEDSSTEGSATSADTSSVVVSTCEQLFAQLKELSETCRATHEIFESSIALLVEIMTTHRENIQLVKDGLEILFQVCTPPDIFAAAESGNASMDVSTDSQRTKPGARDSRSYVELLNASTLTNNAESIAGLLSFLNEADFYIRFSCTQLLISLLRSGKLAQIQDAVLRTHSMPNIIALLRDHRDSVRNEALLLLIELVQSNEEIQKLVAFEGTFEVLFQIIKKEGSGDGRDDQAIVVLDCLALLAILLKGNVLNQNYFRETDCMQYIAPLITVTGSDLWFLTEKKMQCLAASLNLIECLVQSTNSSTVSNQQVLRKLGIPQKVLQLGLSRVNSVLIRSRALRTLAGLLHAQPENHYLLATTSMTVGTDQSTQPKMPLTPSKALLQSCTADQPALSRLLRVTLSSTSYFERSSALRAFGSYLFQNADGQLALVSTLTPVPVDDSAQLDTLPIGRQLIAAMMHYQDDPLRAWFSSLLLSYMVRDNEEAQNFLLKIPFDLPTDEGNLVLLRERLRSLLSLLIQDKSVQPIAVVGYLRFACLWISHCPRAVEYFYEDPTTISFLVEAIIQPTGDLHIRGLCALFFALSFLHTDDPKLKNTLHGLISHRIGTDKFSEKLRELRKSMAFMAAEQGNEPEKQEIAVDETSFDQLDRSVLFYDYGFTLFFKEVYDETLREIKYSGQQQSPLKQIHRSSQKTNQRQADEIKQLKKQLDIQAKELEIYKLQTRNFQQQVDTLKSLPSSPARGLALNEDAQSSPSSSPSGSAAGPPPGRSAREADLEREVLELRLALETRNEQQKATASADHELQQQYDSMVRSYALLESALQQKTAELAQAKTQAQSHSGGSLRGVASPEGESGSGSGSEALLAELEQLRVRNDQLSHEKRSLESRAREEKEHLLRQLAAAHAQVQAQAARAEAGQMGSAAVGSISLEELATLRAELEAARHANAELQQKLTTANQEYTSLEAEQEELLVCLATTELENSTLKAKLQQEV